MFDWQASSKIFNGTYTLVGPHGRRTVKVETVTGDAESSGFLQKFKGRRVVKLLTGSANDSSYTMIGWLRPGDNFIATRKSAGTDMEKIGNAFVKITTNGIQGYSFIAACTCRRCNRTLTVPSSIDAGLGPVCAKAGG